MGEQTLHLTWQHIRAGPDGWGAGDPELRAWKQVNWPSHLVCQGVTWVRERCPPHYHHLQQSGELALCITNCSTSQSTGSVYLPGKRAELALVCECTWANSEDMRDGILWKTFIHHLVIFPNGLPFNYCHNRDLNRSLKGKPYPYHRFLPMTLPRF